MDREKNIGKMRNNEPAPAGTILYDSGDGVRKLAGAVTPDGNGGYVEVSDEFKTSAAIFGKCADVASEMLKHGAELLERGETPLGEWWDACGRIVNTAARLRCHPNAPPYAHELADAAQRIVAKMEADLAKEGLSPDLFRNVFAPGTFSERDEEFFWTAVTWCRELQRAITTGGEFRETLDSAARRLTESVTTVYRGLCPPSGDTTLREVREALEEFEAFDDPEKLARAVMRAAKVQPNRVRAFRNAKAVEMSRQKPET
jgi:hypothetical protein